MQDLSSLLEGRITLAWLALIIGFCCIAYLPRLLPK